MDWIAIGTLVAALVAAVGAVWAALISQRQLAIAKQASSLPLPIVEANIEPVPGQSAWSAIHLRMRNRADIPVDLLRVKQIAPKAGLLSSPDAHEAAMSNIDAPRLFDPLPAEKAAATVKATGRMGPAGSDARHGGGEWAVATVYCHCALSRLVEEPQPRLSLEMRWRDQTTKTFAMAVNIIKPNTA